MSSFGGGGNPGPTKQQQQLEAAQGVQNAQLNVEENMQRKAILNALQGTRMFRGSALSRALAGNTAGTRDQQQGGPSGSQRGNDSGSFLGSRKSSLLDQAPGSGAASAGGAGPSNSGSVGTGSFAGAGGSGGGARRGAIP